MVKCTKKLMVLLMAILMLLPSMMVDAEEILTAKRHNPLAMDVVILMDQSARMVNREGEGADPEGYRMDAAMIMISMCDMEYSNAAVNWYGLYYEDPKQTTIDKYMILSLGGDVIRLNNLNREAFYGMMRDSRAIVHSAPGEGNSKENGLVSSGSADQKRITKPGKHGGMYYDFTTTFSMSVDALKNSDSGNRKVILLIAAGEPEIGNDRRDEYERVKDEAEAAGVEIFVINVNTSGSGRTAPALTELDCREQPDVITNSAELPITMNRIFANLIGSKMHTSTSNGIINIPNSSVKEVNIIVPIEKDKPDTISLQYEDENPLNENITEYDPASKNEEQYIITHGLHFKSYKLINPRSGNWYLSDENGPITADLQYVFSYNVVSQTTPIYAKSETNKSTPVNVKTVFYEDGIPSKDGALYTSINAELIVKEENARGALVDVEGSPLKMTGDPDNRWFVYESQTGFDFPEGKYHFFVRLTGAGLEREEYLGAYTLVNSAPKAKMELSEDVAAQEEALTEFVYNSPDTNENNMEPVELKLDDYFEEQDNDGLRYEISSEQPVNATVEMNESNVLTVTPKESAGETSVTIRCIDDDGKNPLYGEKTFSISVKDASSKYNDCDVTLIIKVDGNEQTPENGMVEVAKGAEVTYDFSVTGKDTANNNPVLLNPDFTTTTANGEEVDADNPFIAPQSEGEYTVKLTGSFGTEPREKSVTIKVVNQLPSVSEEGNNLVLSDMLDGGGQILSMFGDQTENTYWIGNGYFCSPTSDLSFPVSNYFSDPDGVNDKLTYSVSVYGPASFDENGEEIRGNALIENEPTNFTMSEDGTEYEEFTLKSGAITQEGKYTIVFKATDKDNEEVIVERVFLVESVVEKAKDNFFRLLLYIAIGLVACLILIRMMKPKFKAAMHFKIQENSGYGVIVKGNSDYLRSLGRPKGEHSLSEVYQESAFSNFGISDMLSHLGAVIFKPAYGNGIKVKLNKKAYRFFPKEELRVRVAGNVVKNVNFSQRISSGASIDFQQLDADGNAVGNSVEYVFMAYDEE